MNETATTNSKQKVFDSLSSELESLISKLTQINDQVTFWESFEPKKKAVNSFCSLRGFIRACSKCAHTVRMCSKYARLVKWREMLFIISILCIVHGLTSIYSFTCWLLCYVLIICNASDDRAYRKMSENFFNGWVDFESCFIAYVKKAQRDTERLLYRVQQISW